MWFLLEISYKIYIVFFFFSFYLILLHIFMYVRRCVCDTMIYYSISFVYFSTSWRETRYEAVSLGENCITDII